MNCIGALLLQQALANSLFLLHYCYLLQTQQALANSLSNCTTATCCSRPWPTACPCCTTATYCSRPWPTACKITLLLPVVIGLGQEPVQFQRLATLVHTVQVPGQLGQHSRLAVVQLTVAVLVLCEEVGITSVTQIKQNVDTHKKNSQGRSLMWIHPQER